MNKNHEGYSDPTACKAVRRVSKYKRKKKEASKQGVLTYRLNEVPGFKQFMR